MRPNGITRMSRIPGHEFTGLVFFLILSIGYTDTVIDQAADRRALLKAMVACM